MLPSATPTRLAGLATAALLALPGSALAQSAASHDPVAHIASVHRRAGHTASRAHKSARCHTVSVKRHGKHERRCVRAHKSSRKRAHASRLRRRPTSPTPTPAPTQAPQGTPGDPAGTVSAPTLTITGTTYYVSPSGSDSSSGTSPSTAWRTVQRVNRASLHPGDGVLFQGGATFSDEALMPGSSGTAGSPVVFGSYGQGDATLPQGVWFRGREGLAFEHLTMGPQSGFQGTGHNVVIEWCTIANVELAINAAAGESNANNTNWTIDDNTIEHIGNSGMLLEGEDFTVSGNTIANTGLDESISYGKHGIYLKVVGGTVTSNTIVNSSADGISVRYRDSRVERNYIQGAQIGVAWFQYDSIAGTSYWLDNTIVGVSEAGFYVSESNIGGNTRESFVIEHNAIQPDAGAVPMNLKPTTGTYTVQENT